MTIPSLNFMELLFSVPLLALFAVFDDLSTFLLALRFRVFVVTLAFTVAAAHFSSLEDFSAAIAIGAAATKAKRVPNITSFFITTSEG
jgi:hypothetical protein